MGISISPTLCHYNAQCAMFAAQVVFSFTAMVFCMVSIVNGGDRELQVFLPILSGIVSVWMPTPSVPRKRSTGPGPGDVTPPGGVHLALKLSKNDPCSHEKLTSMMPLNT